MPRLFVFLLRLKYFVQPAPRSSSGRCDWAVSPFLQRFAHALELPGGFGTSVLLIVAMQQPGADC